MRSVVRRRNAYPTPPPTPRKPGGSMVKTMLPAAASALFPKARGAIQAAKVGYRVAKFIQSRKSRNSSGVQRAAPRRRVVAFTGVSSAVYRGKFRRPRSAKKGQYLEKICQKRGHLVNQEVYGDVADPDCVYIVHSTYSATNYAKTIAYALLRKLLVKAGFNPDTVDQELPFYDYNNADGFKIQYILKDGSNNNFVTSYTTVDDDTMATVLTPGKLPLIDTITALLNSYTSGQYLERIQLFISDRNGVATNWRLKTEINLEREVLTMYSTSEIMIQNRTKGAAATGNETERVDSQPLKGYTYICNGATPKTQTMGVTTLDSASTNGIVLARAAQLNSALKEPPVSNFFTNCYKRGVVALDPGVIKSASIYIKYRGFFNNVLAKFRTSSASNTVQIAHGKCQIFALEETLNTGSANNITVSYEVQKKYGCFLTTTKKTVLLASYDSVAQSNTS